MSAALPGGRFVVQAHDAPPLHYDLMLEQGEGLATFGLPQPPETELQQAAEPKADHRREYLEYEGAVSGGRGTTRIWDRGTYRAEPTPEGALRIELTGERARGWFRLERRGEGTTWRPESVPSEAPAGAAPANPHAPPGRPRRSRDGSRGGQRSGKPLIVRVLQLLAVVVLVGGISYAVALNRYRETYRNQTYLRVIQLYQSLLDEKDALRFNQRVERFEQQQIGQPALVVGRVGAIEPATPDSSHKDGPAVFLWVNVPNMVESGDSTPLDVRCVIPAAQLELEPVAAGGGGAHRHRWRHGDLIVVAGTLVRFNVNASASHAVLLVGDASARDPGPVERHFYTEEAKPLGVREPLGGIYNPVD